jgi:DUF1680 family protein
MKKVMKIKLSFFIAVFFFFASCKEENKHDYPYSPVTFTSVEVTDFFWGQRLQASREVTIPLAFSKCEETGRYRNFVQAAEQMKSEENLGFVVRGLPFDDTDVYKTIEGASYLLQTYPDSRMEAYIDSILTLISAAQEPDGYLYTARTKNPKNPHRWSGAERWIQIEDSHELYNLGHMIEGAIAHYRATGKRTFLDIAIRYADYVCREIGPNEGQQVRVPGHQIAEMALAKLYTVTGEKKYLDEAKFFIDMRGRGEKGMDSYRQSHIPVIEQDEPVGHAVRAEYMYSGMADVAALTGNKIYIAAIDKIWENLVSKKLYLTGGVGARREGEAFGDAYELPNLTSYCETCAAIGNVYTNFRMFLLHGESKYIDVLERTLYNGVLSGISLDGGSFFYPNPLESDGRHHRQPWFGCACCPSNIARFIPSVAGYVYSVKDNDLFVNLYMSNNVNTSVKNGDVKLSVDTNYPWDGEVTLVLKEAPKKGFELKLRIPGWVRNEVVPSDLYTYADKVTPGYSVKVNGVEVHTMLNDGYFCIKRKWKAGDKVELSMEVIPRVVKANPLVKDNEGRIAVEKGPIVYCAEWADNPGINVREAVVDKNPSLVVKRDPNKLYGIDEIIVDGSDLVLIPYYAWNHRGAGDMSVWIRIK